MIIRLLLSALAIYAAFMVILYLVQRQLIYQPNKTHVLPAQTQVPELRVVKLKTQDGLVLDAWYTPSPKPAAPTIIVFHGNAGNIADRQFLAKTFIKAGFGVLLVTYRGYSGNPGKPTEQGLYADGRAALLFVEQQKAHCIVLYGESLGGAVAVQMATEYKIAALILQSPFTALADVAAIHYPFLPVRYLLRDRFASLSKIKQIHVPIFVMHGERDFIVPTRLGKRLYEAAGEPKQAKYYKGHGHNDLFSADEDAVKFIQEHVPCH